jgi:hypothetical protein
MRGVPADMEHLVGLLDDIAIFNRVLTADEIRALYNLKAGDAELHTAPQ